MDLAELSELPGVGGVVNAVCVSTIEGSFGIASFKGGGIIVRGARKGVAFSGSLKVHGKITFLEAEVLLSDQLVIPSSLSSFLLDGERIVFFHQTPYGISALTNLRVLSLSQEGLNSIDLPSLRKVEVSGDSLLFHSPKHVLTWFSVPLPKQVSLFSWKFSESAVKPTAPGKVITEAFSSNPSESILSILEKHPGSDDDFLCKALNWNLYHLKFILRQLLLLELVSVKRGKYYSLRSKHAVKEVQVPLVEQQEIELEVRRKVENAERHLSSSDAEVLASLELQEVWNALAERKKSREEFEGLLNEKKKLLETPKRVKKLERKLSRVSKLLRKQKLESKLSERKREKQLRLIRKKQGKKLEEVEKHLRKNTEKKVSGLRKSLVLLGKRKLRNRKIMRK